MLVKERTITYDSFETFFNPWPGNERKERIKKQKKGRKKGVNDDGSMEGRKREGRREVRMKGMNYDR